MFAAFADFLIRRRWAVLAVAAVATAAAAVIAPRIRFDFTPQAVLGDGDGSVAYSNAFKETFGHDDAALLVLVEAVGADDVLDRRALAWQADMADRLAAVPEVRNVSCLATMQVARLVFRSPWVVRVPLVRRWPIDAEEETRLRAAVGHLPLVEGNLLSADRRLTAIVVDLDPDHQDIDTTRRALGAIEAQLEAVAPPPGYRLRLGGFPAIRVDIVRQLRKDLALLIPVAGLVLLGALAVAYRRLSGTLVPLAAVGAGVAWSTAVLVLSGQTLSIISSILPVLMLTIGMSNCVHVVSQYGEQCRLLEGRRLPAVRRTITLMAWACLLTYLTTAIGFGSLAATDCDVLTALGWQAALGMGFLYVSTLVVSAVLLPSFAPPRAEGVGGSLSLTTHVCTAAAHFVTRHPRSVVAASGAVVLGALAAGWTVPINSHMMESFDADTESMRSMRLLDEKLGGFITLDVSLEADRDGLFLEPDVFRRVQQAQRFAAERPAVLIAQSYVDLHEAFLAGAERRIEQSEQSQSPDDARRQALARGDMILRSLGDAADYDRFMSADGRRARIMLRASDLGTRDSLVLIDEVQATLDELFPDGGPIRARLTGDAYVHAKTIDGFIRTLLLSLVAASVIIFALIALLFRSLELGLISIAPNLTPLVVTLGYMAVRGYELNVTHVIVFAISLGIAVDGTIHFLARFRREEKRTTNAAEAIERSFRGAGRAIVLANLVVLCGLGVLLLSDFVPTRRFAELGAITMLGALLGTLLLLPACLMLYHRRRYAGASDSIESDK